MIENLKELLELSSTYGVTEVWFFISIFLIYFNNRNNTKQILSINDKYHEAFTELIVMISKVTIYTNGNGKKK